ncbi:MAG: TonB family protein [Flammeovirgaceae bacterium]|nr:TonB family protein [Flammeovirgaceae bacterium]
MSNQKFHRESNTNLGISAEEMQQYLKGELSAERMYLLEKKMLEEELYEDAMEGLEGVNDLSDFNNDVVDLRNQLNKRVGKQESKSVFFNYKSYGIAATLLLLIVSSYLFINNFGVDQKSDTMVTEARETIDMEQESEAPKKEELKEIEADKNTNEMLSLRPESSFNVSPPNEEKKKPSPTEIVKREIEKPSLEVVPQGAGAGIEEEDIIVEKEIQPAAEDIVEEEILLDDELPGNFSIAIQDSVQSVPNQEITINKAFSSKAKKTASKNQIQEAGRVLKGKVLSQEDNEPLAGVSITLKGSNVGTLSDINDDFFLPINSNEENTTVQISFIGFDTQEVALGRNDEVDFYLSADLSQLDEVVVVNYRGEKIDIVNSGVFPDENGDIPALRREINNIKEAQPEKGTIKYKKYLAENLQYPEEAKSQKVEGVVKLKLSLDDKGNIVDVVVENSVGHGCDEEAIRLVKEGPKWEPKRINGIAWESEKTVKVRFKL